MNNGLSTSSKMPLGTLCLSFPISECKTGSKLAKKKGTPCFLCYGKGGNFRFSAVQAALKRNLDEYNANPSAWIGMVVSTINRNGATLFRWFPVGDLQSVEMLVHICTVALQTPDCRHWLPTQERKILAEFFKQGNTLPPNLVVRVSSSKLDTVQHGQSGVSSLVVTSEEKTKQVEKQGYYICPANTKQNGKCQQCRACWTRANIAYPLHVGGKTYPKSQQN